MLRQVYIIVNDVVLIARHYGKALSESEFSLILPDIKNDAFSRLGSESGSFNYYKYKVSYCGEKNLNLLIILVTGLSDDFNRIKTELFVLKKEFLNLFSDNLNGSIDPSMIEIINPTIDTIHRNLKPKIVLIGFSGVGKTTITKLIKQEEIPLEHIPTITGEVAAIKIGKLTYFLWDFAGQEQFSFLWNKFIRGSDAVLLVTDSTHENIEKSKFFLELIKEEAPYANSAIIGNKQDMPNAVKVEDIERIMGLKTYSMIATEPGNRDKMIKIIADVLDMSVEISPLLKPLYERDLLIGQAQEALQNSLFKETIIYFEKIADLCIEIGDDSLAKDFYEKSKNLKKYLELEDLN